MKAIQIVSLLALATAALLPAAAQSLLVVNQESSDVSIIDPAAQREVTRIAENTPGVHAHEVAVSADGRTAWLPVYGDTGVGKPGIDGHEVLVLDVPSRRIVSHIDFGHGVRPHLPVLDAAHGLLYVTTELDKSVAVIDTKTQRIVGSVPTGQEQSHMLAISHDGRLGYTANVEPSTVSVLDLINRKTLAVIPVVQPKAGSWGVQRIALSADDKLAFTADGTQPRLAAIDTTTRKLRTWIPLPAKGYGSAATADGKWLLVAVPSANEMAVVDMKTLTVVRHVPVAASPQEVLIRPDNKVAYVSCAAAGKVSAVNLADWSVSDIAAGRFADGLAWAK